MKVRVKKILLVIINKINRGININKFMNHNKIQKKNHQLRGKNQDRV
jgi:hypothetical protein